MSWVSPRALCVIIVESFDLYIRPWVHLTKQHQHSLENFTTFPWLWFLLSVPSKTTLPETKDLHSTFITVIMTKQCSAATENIRGKRKEKVLLIRSLLWKNQIKPIDLITRRLRTLMVIARYKCAGKGTDSPKVERLKVSSIYKLWVRISWKVIFIWLPAAPWERITRFSKKNQIKSHKCMCNFRNVWMANTKSRTMPT